jgi:hypothetical protein
LPRAPFYIDTPLPVMVASSLGRFIPGTEPSVSMERRLGGTQSGRCGEGKEKSLVPIGNLDYSSVVEALAKPLTD